MDNSNFSSSSTPSSTSIKPNPTPSKNHSSADNSIPLSDSAALVAQSAPAKRSTSKSFGITSTPQDGTFDAFPDLPTEVQLLVWAHAAENRARESRLINIILNYKQSASGILEENINAVWDMPLLLLVCHKSRKEALKVWSPALGHLLANPVYINFEHDVVLFGGPLSKEDGSNTFGSFINSYKVDSAAGKDQLTAMKKDLRHLVIGGPTCDLYIFQFLQLFWQLKNLELPWTSEPAVDMNDQGEYNMNLAIRLMLVWGKILQKEMAIASVEVKEGNREAGKEQEEEEWEPLEDEEAEVYFGGPTVYREEDEISEAITTRVDFLPADYFKQYFRR